MKPFMTPTLQPRHHLQVCGSTIAPPCPPVWPILASNLNYHHSFFPKHSLVISFLTPTGEKIPLCTLSQWSTHVWIIFHSFIWFFCPIILKSLVGRGYALSTSDLGVSLYTKELSKYQLNWSIGWVVKWMVNFKSIFHIPNYFLFLQTALWKVGMIHLTFYYIQDTWNEMPCLPMIL